MKILVFTQFYHPEPGATSNRLKSLVDALVNRGHDVTVICEFSNHPNGVLAKEDKWKVYMVEDKGNHRIIRTFVIPFKKKNIITRLIFYSSFAISSFIAGLIVKKHDIVLSSSPPPFHVYLALLLSKIKRSKFVYDVRDLLTRAAQEMNVVNNGMILNLTKKIDACLYKNANILITVTQGFKKVISNEVNREKIFVIQNGSDIDMMNWDGNVENIRNKMGWENKIVVTFAGNIGVPQAIPKLIKEISTIEDDRLQFVLIGDGPLKDYVTRIANNSNLSNILLLGQIPRSEVIPLTHASDIMLISLEELEVFKITIPSKFYDSMAAGKPVLSNVDGELKNIMEKHKTGLHFSFNNSGSFKKSLMKLVDDERLRIEYGANGKSIVKERFLRNKLGDKFVDIIEKVK